MASEMKFCCYCGRQGHLGKDCTWPRNVDGVLNAYRAFSNAKARWIKDNPEASGKQIEEQTKAIAQEIGL